jgi:transposase
MCFIGVDAHRQLIAAVAVDEAGQELGDWTGANNGDAWAELLVWAETTVDGGERRWGIEGSGNQGRGLAQRLVAQGEMVFEINPRWTSDTRGRSRQIDKSDHADARAITRLMREEGDRLPRVNRDDATTPLAILTRERESLVADITRNRNRLHAELLRLDPAYKRAMGSLRNRAGLEAVLALDDRSLGASQRIQLHSAQRRATRMLALLDDLDAVSAELETLAEPLAGPLTTMFGVAALTAGMLAGYLGPGRRVRLGCRTGQVCRGGAPSDSQCRGHAAPTQPDRPSPAQCSNPPHCPDAGTRLSTSTRIRASTDGRRQELAGGDPGTETLPGPGDLPALEPVSR